jgi:glycosyltransferase involved in cell wall biosynthesis
MKHQPLISVILPAYNGARYLSDTIGSVLAQTYRPLEVIVVDDGSKDDSAEIAGSFDHVRVLIQENQGVPFARNAGIAAANGDYLCFIDQDDTWLPEKVQKQLESFTAQQGIRYCLTRQVFYLSEGEALPDWCPPDWLDKPVAGFSPSTLMIERSLMEEMGPFDTSLLTGSDTEFFFHLKDKQIPFHQLEEVLVRKRVHGNNQSATRDQLRRDILETVRRSIQRQRNMQPNS